MISEFCVNVGKGVMIGAVASLIGFFKAQPDKEKLEWKKLVPTLIIGGVTGGTASYLGINLASAESLIGSYGVISLVNSLWTALMKRAEKRGWF